MRNTSLHLSISGLEDAEADKAKQVFDTISGIIKAKMEDLDPRVNVTMEMLTGESVAESMAYSRGVSETHLSYGVLFLIIAGVLATFGGRSNLRWA